ncbi:MAG TPA: MFS transporter [Verrucomicrobiae bacterium]|nr:MFS transporter [Verrucomicrobiae bacterium]
MFSRRLKFGYFVIEGLNSFATVYYFYYLYFFMQQVYGFGNKANLVLAALNGATYALTAWFAGKFAQRHGYFTALKTGYAIMVVALSFGLLSGSAAGRIWAMTLNVVGMSFTWPTLEALVSEGEPRSGLQHMVGVYNVVWAATAALANFSGGAMLQKLGLTSLFCIPISIHLTQLCLTLWLESKAAQSKPATAVLNKPAEEMAAPLPEGFGIPKAQRFLRMAWLANPFGYIAINTLIAVVPGVARRLELSTMAAGFCCSVWCFARLGAFAVLWRWAGWHYRFRWLFVAYLALVGSFACTVLAPGVAMLVVAQLVFGAAVGLLYYSSLFYSMDRSETKGEHGGIHEAAIGLGNCAGPAVGAATLQLLPQHAQSGTVAVIVLLLCGLGGLVGIWRAKAL